MPTWAATGWVGCVNDTKKWSKFFTDRKFQVTVLTDQQATFDAIVTAIKTLIDSAVSGDIVPIHYSGHGTRVPDASKQEVDGQDEALVPIDFGTKGFIVDDLIGPLLDRAKPGVAVHVFFDCCHSGGGTRLLATSEAAGSEDEKVRFLVLTPKMIEVHNRAPQKRAASNQLGVGTRAFGPAELLAIDGTMREVLFATCQSSEQAIESGGNGHFTRAAMAVLARPATGLTNDQFLKAVIAEMGAARPQTPQLSCSSGINAAPFLTFVSPAGPGITAKQPVVPPGGQLRFRSGLPRSTTHHGQVRFRRVFRNRLGTDGRQRGRLSDRQATANDVDAVRAHARCRRCVSLLQDGHARRAEWLPGQPVGGWQRHHCRGHPHGKHRNCESRGAYQWRRVQSIDELARSGLKRIAHSRLLAGDKSRRH